MPEESALARRTMTALRGIAQSFEIPDIFKLTKDQLVKAIEIKQQGIKVKEEPVLPPRPEYDGRLMTRPPAKKGSQEEIEEMLGGHVALGLHLTFPEPENWHMRFAEREDTGTMRQPLIAILRCAEKVLRG